MKIFFRIVMVVFVIFLCGVLLLAGAQLFLGFQGKNAFLKHDYIQAVKYYEWSNKIYGRSFSVNYMLATSHHELGQFQREIPYLTKCRELDSTNATIYKMAGEVYMQFGDVFEAIKVYTISLRYDPMNSNTFVARANAYSSAHFLDSAKADYERAIKIDPDNFNAFRYRGFYYEKTEKNLEKAIKNYKIAAAINQNDSQSLLLLARCYEKSGDKKNAIKTYELLLSKGNSNKDSISHRIKRLKKP